MKKLQKLLSFVLVICLGMCFVGCGSKTTDTTPPPAQSTTLSTPTNLTAVLSNGNGIITWAPVENATSYIVTLNGEEKTVVQTYYQILNVVVDYNISVVAHADGYTNSQAAVVTLKKPDVIVGISGKSEVRSGEAIQLSANVEGTNAKTVTWEITDGKEYAKIDNTGRVVAEQVSSDKLITVKATSTEDTSAYAIKRITVVARPEFNQGMLDAIDGDKLGFEGFLVVNLYSIATNRFYSSVSYDIKTAMDGTNWYAQYEMSSGVSSGLYYQNHEGNAALVSVSFMNDASYTTLLDDNGAPVSWEDSGLYNNFTNLDEADFPLDITTWRRTYRGDDEELAQRVVASACPYDFKAKNFSFIVEEGEIAGIYAESEDDYTVAEQYIARMELTVAINTGDAVNVPTLHVYDYEEDFHGELNTAIQNMRELESYTMDFLNVGANVVTSSYDSEGFEETVTEDVCHFRPYMFTPNSGSSVGSGEGMKRFTNADYGYVDRSTPEKALYNSYYVDESNKFVASRAYEEDFANAKPTFEFSAALFTQRYNNEEDGTITYYVDEPMSSVASMFYYGVGNDIALYGLFAQKSFTSPSFTPYVVVKDGYIVEAGFYYYLGYLYGVVELGYGKFNETSTDTAVQAKLDVMDTREVPTSWDDVMITVSSDNSSTSEDVEQNALEYLQEFYADENIADKLPFFGDALGDTYGFGLTTFKTYNRRLLPAVIFYYDVPLDVDYTIESSLAAVRELLIARGFTGGRDDVFSKGDIFVQPMDSSLDLVIYVWRDATATTPSTPDEPND